MTRRIQLSSQQRVDQPDVLAISSLAVQDVRRHQRQLLMGRDADTQTGRVIRGFKVEAEVSGVSTRIIVKHDDGGVLGSFMGAIDLGAGNIDFGQLTGGKDGLGNLEGSAQNIADFSGKPITLYEVKVRAVFAPGILDNKAFWNPATDAEFIAPTNTRLLPQWELAFENHSGAEWVLIGSVDWGGATVSDADIIDLRKFPIEGQPVDTAVVAEQWSHAAQEDVAAETLGVGDFDRNEDRGDSGAAINALWESGRALARQIQDIKGGRESDLRYDWFSRVHAAPGRLAADPTDKTTRTMRTMDTVTFTCADGVTDHGDFNGLNSVNDCFTFIAANGGSVPNHIDIVVKSRSVGTPLFTWNNSVAIVGKSISLIATGGAQDFDAANEDSVGEHLVQIITSVVNSAPAALSMTLDSSLHLEGVSLVGQPDSTTGIIDCDRSSKFTCARTVMTASFVGDAAAPILRCPSQGVKIDKSFFVGVVYIGGRLTPDSGRLFGTAAQGVGREDVQWNPGSVTDSVFKGLLRLRHRDVILASDPTERWVHANRMVWDNCVFDEQVDFQVATGFAASANGQINLLGARNIKFRDCKFDYHGDQTCVRLDTAPTDSIPFTFSKQQNIRFDSCQFKLERNATHAGFQSGAGGVSGVEGTGWAIYAGTPLRVDPTGGALQLPMGLHVSKCDFTGGVTDGEGGDASGPPDTPVDAGFISVHNWKDVWIDDCKFQDWFQPDGALAQGSDIQSMVRLTASAVGIGIGAGQGHRFRDNVIADWASAGPAADFTALDRFVCLDLFGLIQPIVRGNQIDGNRELTTPIIVGDLPAALAVGSCLEPQIEGNTFSGWRETSDPKLNTCVGLLGVNTGAAFKGNVFNNCGGANIVAETAAVTTQVIMDGNQFNVGQVAADFASCWDLSTLGTEASVHYVNNRWDYIQAAVVAVRLESAVGVFIANNFFRGEIEHAAGPGVKADLRGYDVVGSTDLNLVDAYT